MRKTALVTGASRGIGEACAKALASDGYRVIINYNQSEQRAFDLARELGGIAVRADVSDAAQVEKMFEAAGDIDVLVCNAGISLTKLFTDTTTQEWDRIFDVNVTGTASCCRHAAKSMIRKKSGSIITMSSIWGITGASCEVAYSSTKAAIIGFTKALAKELGPSGIRVNCVAPGVINTDMNSGLSKADIDALTYDIPLGTIGTPEDVASVVSFLASDKAAYITGQVIGVNGGFLI